MKNMNNIGKRVLAMALVVMLLMSYAPAGIVAVETDAGDVTAAAKEFKATLSWTITENPVVEETEAPEATTSPATETTGATEGPAEAAEPVMVTTYTYTVKAQFGEEDVTEQLDSIQWFDGAATKETKAEERVADWDDQKSVEDVSNSAVSAIVTYKGLSLLVTSETENTDLTEKSVTWGMVAPNGWTTALQAGIPVEIDLTAVSLNENSMGTADVTYEVTNAVYENNKLIANHGVDSAAITQTASVEGVAVGSFTGAAQVTAPTLDVQFTVDGKTYANGDIAGWFSAAKDVTVTVGNKDLYSADYLPTVYVGGVAQSAAWSEAGEKTWSAKVNIAATGAVTVGNGTLNVKIDTEAPVINNTSIAYVTKGSNVHAIVDVTPTASGIVSVTVGGEAAAIANDEGTQYTADIKNYKSGNLEVVVTAGNGKTASAQLAVQEGVALSISTPAAVGTGSDRTFVAEGSVIQITVAGATAPGTKYALNESISSVQSGETSYKLAWNGTAWTATVPVNADASVNGLYVYVEDVKGRSDTYSDDTTYAVDTSDPVIYISNGDAKPSAEGTTDYYQAPITYTVTVTDNAQLDVKNLAVIYILNGEAKRAEFSGSDPFKKTATFEVKDGDHLTGDIQVIATDSSDNQASASEPVDLIVDTQDPVVSFTVSENVTGFVNVNGKLFAYVDAPVTDLLAGKTTVTITAKATDANLADLAALNPGWTKVDDNTFTYSMEVANHATAEMPFSFTVKDKAERIGGEKIYLATIVSSPTAAAPSMELTRSDAGTYSGTVNIDRRIPSSVMDGVPTVNLVIPDGFASQTKGTLDLFNGTVKYDVVITDQSANGADSGIASIIWSVNDEKVTLNDSPATLENGTYTIEGTVEKKGHESDNVMLSIKVADAVGNGYTFTKPLAVDNQGARVEVTKTIEDPEKQGYGHTQTVNGEDYYDGPVTYSIRVEELNVKTLSAVYTLSDGSKHEVELTQNNTVYTGSFTVKNLEILTDIVLVTDDTYNNAATITVTDADTLTSFDHDSATNTWTYSGNDVVVDMETPKITVTKSSTASYTRTGKDGVNYYSGAEDGTVTYNVKVTDDHLTNLAGAAQALTLSYTVEGKEPVVVELGENTAWTIDETGAYTYAIVVNNGELLTDISITAKDNAGNPAKIEDVTVEDGETASDYTALVFEGADGTYTAKPMTAVDNTDPVVSVQKAVENGNYIQTEDEKDYYTDDVIYKITVKDTFLNEQTGISVKTSVAGKPQYETVEMKRTAGAEGAISGEDVYEAFITVKEGTNLDDIRITVVDDAANKAETLQVTDPHKLTLFNYKADSNTHEYAGNDVVVDKTDPVVTMAISSNVQNFFTNAEGTSFARLNPESIKDIAEKGKAVKVALTVTVSDVNLSDTTCPEAEGWTKVTGTDGLVTYEKTIEVSVDAHQSNSLDYNVHIKDLAGHYHTNEVLLEAAADKDADGFNSSITLKVDKDSAYVGSLLIDRRTPSSVSGEALPEVKLTHTVKNVPTVEADGKALELFAGNFDFTMAYTDASVNAKDSGIKSINWSIDDGLEADFLDATGTLDVTKTEGTIAVAAKGNNESNNVTLNVILVDYVGNTFNYTKKFAFDNLAPRVTVNVSGESARNNEYFNVDRTATVTVEDLNFSAANTKIDTQVEPTGWTAKGIVWTNSYVYNTDGEYTFAFETKDLAGNVTADTQVTYEGQHPTKFVIDKTAPVINVRYFPGTSIDTDPAGVHYYNQDLDVSVTITEVNFAAGDVKANMGPNNSLGGWYSSGSTHTASETYTEGNNYSFTIDFTDLAGNAAVGYKSDTFSVDLGQPTIEISRGSLTNESLNILQGDLELSFRINDEQENLKNYDMKVTHLNNEFKATEIDGSDYFTVTGDGSRTTVTIDFTTIEAIKENDGIYTVEITAQDYAGHTVSLMPDLVFSLNRFGSTFLTDDSYTSDFLTPSENGVVYNSNVENKLVIKEINPNKVWQDESKAEEGSTLTINVNGNTVQLQKGTDYQVSVEEQGTGGAKWYVYTYEIDPANFLETNGVVNGKYTVLIYGVDEAGNMNTNESNEYSSIQQDAAGAYSGKIEFTLDNLPPVLAIMGVESGESYNATNQKMQINVSDSSPAGIAVYLNGEQVILQDSIAGLADDQVWLAYDEETGNYVLNITEQTSEQTVKILATDAAGNVLEEEVAEILITTNTFVRLINNPVVVGGAGVGGVGIIALIILFLKKKKDEEAKKKSDMAV